MPLSQNYINKDTPMGANMAGAGATFRVWLPDAREVYLLTGGFSEAKTPAYTPDPDCLMTRNDDGSWTGFLPGIKEGDPYLYYVVGHGGKGLKRDSHARELSSVPPFPESYCLLCDPSSYPWHDAGFRTPAFSDMVIYQLHVGAFYGVDANGNDKRLDVAKFLDVIEKVEYLRDMGVNAVQLLPIQEFPFSNSLGYNNLDFYSPEMAYQVEDTAEVRRYLPIINGHLQQRGAQPLTEDQLACGPNQLKALVDICHINGIAVIFDVVYNHAGGDFGDYSIYFHDRRVFRDNNDSLYFTNDGWAGGLVFAYWNDGVRQFLIDNAKFLLDEYHIDGLRYDEVSVIDNHGGWRFCQDITSTLRYVKPQAIQIAEYWKEKRELAVIPPPGGMGFDFSLGDGLRDAIRNAVGQAAGGRDSHVDLDRVKDALYGGALPASRSVQHIENHDIVYAGRPPDQWKPRVARLADPSNPRSWYARSRSRAASALLLSAPGIPMLFMGQEILEDKNWSDNPCHYNNSLIWWDGLKTDKAMADFNAFMRDMIWLRRNQPALRGANINVFHVHSVNRVIAFHRWVDWEGKDVVVAASLNESAQYGYSIGFPSAGLWREELNTDYYDTMPNPSVSGNGGRITADGPPMHGMPASAAVVLPANGAVFFVRED